MTTMFDIRSSVEICPHFERVVLLKNKGLAVKVEQGEMVMKEEPNSDGVCLPDSGKIGPTISSTSPTP